MILVTVSRFIETTRAYVADMPIDNLHRQVHTVGMGTRDIALKANHYYIK